MKFRMIISIFFILSISTIQAQSVLDHLLAPAQLPVLKQSRMYQISSFDSTGGNADRIVMAPGETATLARISGPAVITRIWVTISSPDPFFLRRIVLRMFWDDEPQPSVETPVGDFFGTGMEYRQFLSAFVGMSSGGYFCYFPMPFNRSARIEVENQTGQEVYAFYYHIDYQKLEQPLSPDVAYFHAHWRREPRTDPSQNYTILDAEGQGHFVGLNLSMQSYEGKLWFLEGDEMVYVDGERFPSIYGTGTEDYFTSGWYFNHGEFAGLYHGLILKDDSTGRIAAYRFHVGDAIPFKKSLRFTIEHGHANEEIADYSSTAYWYQKEPHKVAPALLKPSLRIPLRSPVPRGSLEAENLVPLGAGLKFYSEDMSDFGPAWSGLKQLKIILAKPGATASLKLPVIDRDRYNVEVFFTLGPDYSDLDVFYGDQKVGEIQAYQKQVGPGGKIELKNLVLSRESSVLKFVATGKPLTASNYALGLDAFILKPERNFIKDWYLIGPFPNPRDAKQNRLGLDIVYAPEKEIILEKTYPGVEDQQVHWEIQAASESGYINFWPLFNPNELVVVYALTFIHSPKKQTVPLLLGTDDGVKVFINDREVHRKILIRPAAPDQDRIDIDLQAGWNKLLLKIENNFGGYGFFARILDLDETLKYSLSPGQ